MAWWSVTLELSNTFFVFGRVLDNKGSARLAYGRIALSTSGTFGYMSSLRYVVSTRGYVVNFFSYNDCISFNVWSAEYPYFLSHSTCKDVRSNNLGADSLPRFVTHDFITNGFSLIPSATSCADNSVLKRPFVD